MSIYHQSHIAVSEDGTSSTQVRVESVELPTGAVVEGEVHLADESEGEKSLKSLNKPELVEKAKELGVAGDIAENLTKAELTEAISRLTHTTED